MALEDLAPDQRLLLMQLLCAFAWTDLMVAASERELANQLMDALRLDDAQRRQVQDWFASPQDFTALDASQISAEHRQLFLQTVERMVLADGFASDRELEALTKLERALMRQAQSE